MDAGNNRTEGRPSTKSDDYLWDGSGEPDPEIQRLEAVLGKFRYDSPTRLFPKSSPIDDGPSFSGGCACFPLWLPQRLPWQPSLQ